MNNGGWNGLPAVQETQVSPWVGKIPWRREWQPPPVFFPGESQGQRSLVDYSPWGRKSRTWLSDWHTSRFKIPCARHISMADSTERWGAGLCWSLWHQLIRVECVYFFPTLPSAMFHWQLETSHRINIGTTYTLNIGKHKNLFLLPTHHRYKIPVRWGSAGVSSCLLLVRVIFSKLRCPPLYPDNHS